VYSVQCISRRPDQPICSAHRQCWLSHGQCQGWRFVCRRSMLWLKWLHRLAGQHRTPWLRSSVLCSQMCPYFQSTAQGPGGSPYVFTTCVPVGHYLCNTRCSPGLFGQFEQLIAYLQQVVWICVGLMPRRSFARVFQYRSPILTITSTGHRQNNRA
jgi:hypothetical protein